MSEQDDRRRLGEAIRADRLRLYGTVESARVANGVKVSRGTWDKAERGEKITEWKLRDIEHALDWPAGKGAAILAGSSDQPDAEERIRALGLPAEAEAEILSALEDDRKRREHRGTA